MRSLKRCIFVLVCVCAEVCVSSEWWPPDLSLIPGVRRLSIETARGGGAGPGSTPKPIPEDRQLIHVHTQAPKLHIHTQPASQ